MTENLDLTGIALVTTLALLGGLVLSRLRQPALVGYVLAGAILGPTGLGLVEGSAGIRTLADLGVLMLLFLIGMELSVQAFQAVYRIAVLTVLLQIGLSLAVTLPAGVLLGWPIQRSVLFGFVVALSSTAVAVKMLEDVGELKTGIGRVVVGVLIAQDLAMVPLLLLTRSLRPDSALDGQMLLSVGAAVGLVGLLVWLLGRRPLEAPLAAYFRREPDMVPLAALAFCFSLATLSGLLGLSAAFGAFVAGFIIGNSSAREAALRATRPIQAVLVVVFFLSVGLLIELPFVWQHLGAVLLFLLLVAVIKTAINVAVLHLLGEPWERAFPAAAIMGQLGEFSFVLAATGTAMGVLDEDGYRLAITVIALSWLFSPLWLTTARRFHAIAADGIVGARALLTRTYGGEIAFLGRAAAVLSHAARLLLRRRAGAQEEPKLLPPPRQD
jgi:CPA2 family monovalent cation:H+ antiporter-2